jgi:ankyrin repeat protein
MSITLSAVGWLVSPVVSILLDQVSNTLARSVRPSSQTQQHPYRRTRGRIARGSANQVVAAQSPPTSASDPSVTETTSAVQVSINPSPFREGSSRHAPMPDELFEVSTKGDLLRLRSLVVEHGTDILFTVTPYQNSPLHLAVMLGHSQKFVMEICDQAPSLLSFTNIHKETPLIAALMAHNETLAFWLIEYASRRRISNIANPLKDMHCEMVIRI